nr:MAG TPA: hypothetical protein [Bacteriophage sp.]
MNIAEILKDAPKGTKLYSPLFGEVELQSVSDTRIEVEVGMSTSTFYKDGRYYKGYTNSECLLFPSEDKRNWNNVCFLKDKAPVMVSDDGYDWRLRNFRDNHAAYLLDGGGNIVTYCYWNYVVPISKFNFEDPHSSILNALQ